MIAWFARNSVAANLLMVFVVASGLIGLFQVRGETFPEIALDMVSVEVPYLGAAPEEVEEAVCIRVEEAIQGIDGIKQITSTAAEGMGIVSVEIELGAEARKVLDDIKNHVDAIDSFPIETEKPIIHELLARQQVVDIAVSGRTDEFGLKAVAERVRDELASLPEISQVELVSARPYEISIEVSELALRRHGLTFDDVSRAVRHSSLDLPGGSVRSDSGEILLRTIGQAYRGAEYEKLVLLARPDGTRLYLGDVATVVDGFAETDQFGRFDAEPTILISVFRTGAQSDLEISRVVSDYVARTVPTLGDGISLTIWQDQSRVLRDRLSLMLRNGLVGFGLVFVVLALFLDLRLAFWVSLGIPISFLGTIMLMPGFDVTFNVVSTFAFILVLGIVVDDAIIVGENIFHHQEAHGDGLRGSIEGAQEIATPVVFAVLTTVAAFTPLLFVPGVMGKMFIFVPLIVIPCLLFSLVESLNILPAHLAHIPKHRRPSLWLPFQRLFAGGLAAFVTRVYRPSLVMVLRWRYVSIALGLSTLVITVGMVLGGWVEFQFFPSPEAEVIAATVTMPLGTPASLTSEIVQRLETSATRLGQQVRAETGQDVFRHIYAAVGDQPMQSRGPGALRGGVPQSAGHLGEVMIELARAEQRQIRAEELGSRWRELTGPIPEANELAFQTSQITPGDDVDVMLIGPDVDRLEAAATRVKEHLREYAGVYDISDTFRAGKQELKLNITPSAETLGLTLEDLGRQVRQAFYGEEAQRIQRGRDDVRVMVRYPAGQRRSLGNLEHMRIRTADRGEVPFSHVAVVEPGRGYASIKRVDRNRAVDVTASVDETVTSTGAVISDLVQRILPPVLSEYPDVSYTFEGMQAEQQDAVGGLQVGFAIALFGIFTLLAIPLRSYSQPLIIMSAIPFGFVGAVWGHVIMGLHVTMMSMMGLVALSGVVVNDSLVLIDCINRKRRPGVDVQQAVQEAGVVRFRPILLTSLTTFVGLAPLMLERSMQAAFLVPMAVSLAFGVVFATVITLGLVPAWYLVFEDVKWILRRVVGLKEPPDTARATA